MVYLFSSTLLIFTLEIPFFQIWLRLGKLTWSLLLAILSLIDSSFLLVLIHTVRNVTGKILKHAFIICSTKKVAHTNREEKCYNNCWGTKLLVLEGTSWYPHFAWGYIRLGFENLLGSRQSVRGLGCLCLRRSLWELLWK